MAGSVLVTERLELRPWAQSEAGEFFELTQDNGFNLFPISNYRQSSAESARAWIRQNLLLHQNGLGKWGVWNRSNRSLIGMGGLTPYDLEDESVVDLTYRLRESAWGQGFGMELALCLVRYGFEELRLREITATITPDNLASKRIAEKLGFKFDKRILLLGVDTDLYRLVGRPK